METARQRTYDLCIVGAGPAGIILALEYEKLQPNRSVLLLEYGRVGRNAARNRLDDSIMVEGLKNHHAPYECTNKGLGGTSASWGGRCVMYDEIDFMQRDILQGQCTWDLSLLEQCLRFAGQAAQYFECGEGVFNLSEMPGFAHSRIAEGFQSGYVSDSVVERWSRPTRFGVRYAGQLEGSPSVHLLTGWEVFKLGVPNPRGAISELGIRDFSGASVAQISAKTVVLAAGTQETTRLLLKNEQVFLWSRGQPPSLGKYYQGHVSGKIASVRFYGDPRKT